MSRNRSLRRPFFESLDARMVLSVCGPDCDLSDGHQHAISPLSGATRHAHLAPPSTTSPAEKPPAVESLPQGESAAIANPSETISSTPITLSVAEHNTHSSSTDWLPVQSAHIEHAVTNDHVHTAYLPVSPSAAHDHAVRYFTSAVVPVDSFAPLHDEQAAPFALQTSMARPEHGAHASTAAKAEPASKLVPKRCTVTTSGGVLITSVDGKRQCDCDAKAQAAQQIKQQLAGDQPAAGLLSALADCQPCQRSALLSGLATDFVVCNLANADNQPISGLPQAMLEQLHGESCPDKSAFDASQEQAAGDAQLLQGLQILGLATLATSVALLPTLRLRPAQRRRDDDYLRAADLLVGRFNVELLT